MRQVTYQDIQNMSPEELEAFKAAASRAVIKKFALIFALKWAIIVALNRWSRRLAGE